MSSEVRFFVPGVYLQAVVRLVGDTDTVSSAPATIFTWSFAVVALKLVHLWDAESSPSFLPSGAVAASPSVPS